MIYQQYLIVGYSVKFGAHDGVVSTKQYLRRCLVYVTIIYGEYEPYKYHSHPVSVHEVALLTI